MAVLKDLIVHGASRFINIAQFNNLQAQTIDATNGYFKYLKAIDGDIENLTVEELLAQNATVVGLLDVKGEMHTNSWTNANIANIGGSFYISPTLSSAASSVTISTYHDSGTNTDYYSIAVSGGSFATSSSGITWSTGSKVMVTGSVTKDNITYPLGTCTGNLSAISSTSFTVNQITQSGIDSAIPGDSTTNGSLTILINTFGSGTIFTSDEIKISMYEIGPSTAYKPVGILLTSYGINKETYIDIYGGVNVKNTNLTDNIPDGFTVPNVRIGYLGGLPSYDDSWGVSRTPTGWGIYTDNGYFKGVVVADSGLVGKFTIADDLHSGTTGIGLDTNVYVSPGTLSEGISIANSPEDLVWAFTAGDKFGVTTDGTLYANQANIEGEITATSLNIGSTNSYDGIAAINISGYLIEIISDSTDVNDPEHTTYLYPILYHNGEKAVPEDYSHFLWYEEGFDTATAGDGDNLGRYLATYGHRYRVTYAFDDGAVEGGTVTQTLMVDPQKYITKINDYGITIHPEIIASNLGYVQIDGNGLKIKQTISDAININNDITLANYGNTITIGQSNSKNVFIDSNGVNIKNGSTILSNFGETITIGQSGNKNVFIDSNGVNIKNGSNILANFGNTITIGQNTSGHTVINTNGMEIFTDTNTSIANFTKENNSFKVRIGLENDARMEITPTSFLAVSAEAVEGFKIEMDAPGLDYPVSITPWNTYIVNDNYVIKTYGIAPLGQQLSVSDCESRWVTTKTVTSITNISSNATANFKYYAGEYTVTLAKVDSNDYIFGINKNEILSATVNFNDNTTQIIQFTISYSSPRTWTFQATATTSLLEFRLMQIPTVTYELEVSTALTSGIRTYGSAKGAFSSVIGEELIATSEAHAAFGRYNNDTLVDPHYLIASFGKGKNELERSNAAAIGFYNPNYDYEVASIYLGLDEAVWLGFMDQPLTPATDDAVIIEAMSNLGWINFDSTTYDCSNKSGSYMLANYYDRSDE